MVKDGARYLERDDKVPVKGKGSCRNKEVLEMQ
jgi:hypothetical protein